MTVLLVANDGGHIKQLHTLYRERLVIDDDVLWATTRTPQTESLLEGQRVFWIHPSPTRDVRAVAANARLLAPVLTRHRVSHAVSTGAAVALSALPQARARGIPATYVESATRGAGPSVTGAILARTPGVRCFTQHPGWAAGRWEFLASPWDRYAPASRQSAPEPHKIVVCLGSQRFGFRRLLERLVPMLPRDAEVLWQTGTTDTSGLGITGHARVPSTDLDQAMREADVVVSHAGTGAALAALEAGRCPVLVPRRSSHGEHIDDHQQQIATDVALRGLAVARDADRLSPDDLTFAASRDVRTIGELQRISLQPT